jgi:hypothetical protein
MKRLWYQEWRTEALVEPVGSERVQRVVCVRYGTVAARREAWAWVSIYESRARGMKSRRAYVGSSSTIK